MRKTIIGDREYEVGEYDLIINDIPARVRIFCDEVMSKNLIRQRKTPEEYLTKMSCALVLRCIVEGYPELVGKILDTALKCGYILCYYKTKLFMYYCDKLLELGYNPEDPYTSHPEREFRGRYQWTETEQSVLAHCHKFI